MMPNPISENSPFAARAVALAVRIEDVLEGNPVSECLFAMMLLLHRQLEESIQEAPEKVRASVP